MKLFTLSHPLLLFPFLSLRHSFSLVPMPQPFSLQFLFPVLFSQFGVGPWKRVLVDYVWDLQELDGTCSLLMLLWTPDMFQSPLSLLRNISSSQSDLPTFQHIYSDNFWGSKIDQIPCFFLLHPPKQILMGLPRWLKESACQCKEIQEMLVWSLGWEDPLEKEMAIPFSIPAWRIPWTEEPGKIQSIESQS